MKHGFSFNKNSNQDFTYSKKLQLTISSLFLVVGLSGCNAQPTLTQVSQNETSNRTTETVRKDRKGKKVILTTFTVLADMAQNVAGDKAIIESITKPGAEIHGYQVTPSDLERGQDADLILENGLSLERWADRFYNSLPKVPHVTLSEGFKPVNIAEDAYQGKPNPHAWMSPKNALIYVENIRKALVKLDSVIRQPMMQMRKPIVYRLRQLMKSSNRRSPLFHQKNVLSLVAKAHSLILLVTMA